MRNTWRHYLRRLAATSVVGGSMAWSSAMCYAVQVAFDSASDAVYSDGWQEGDDGGTAILGPWSFDGTYNTPFQQNLDDGLKTGSQTSSPHNDIGRAWTMYNPAGRSIGTANGATGTDIARSGRSIPTWLEGQTISVVLDNPTERFFYRGYNVKLNSGGANGCFNGDNCTTVAYDPGSVVAIAGVGTFEYFDYGLWDGTTIFDVDTDAGVKIDFTLTAGNTYTLKMTPLDNPGLLYEETNIPLEPGGPVNWIEFQFYNTDSDFYPTMVPANAFATDFYIRSIEITDASAPGQPGDYNGDGTVNAADYVAWRKTPAAFGGDPGGYNTWRENFGEGGAGGSGAAPEPVTFVYLVAGAIGSGSLAVRRGRSG